MWLVKRGPGLISEVPALKANVNLRVFSCTFNFRLCSLHLSFSKRRKEGGAVTPAPALRPRPPYPVAGPSPRGSVHQTHSPAPAPRCGGCLQVTVDSPFKTHKLVSLLVSLGVFLGSREKLCGVPPTPLLLGPRSRRWFCSVSRGRRGPCRKVSCTLRVPSPGRVSLDHCNPLGMWASPPPPFCRGAP